MGRKLSIYNKDKTSKLVIALLLMLFSLQLSIGANIAWGNTSQKENIVSARKAPEFINSIGVEVKFYPEEEDYLWTDIIKPRLEELGVRHIRTRLPHDISVGSNGKKIADRIIELGNLERPIKTTGIWREFGSWNEKILATEYMLSSLEAIENPNEPNRKPEGFDYKDNRDIQHGYVNNRDLKQKQEVGKGWVHAVRLFTEDLSFYINYYFPELEILSSAVTKGAYVKVQDYQKKYHWNLENWVDYGNFHVYRQSNPEKNTRIDDVRKTIFPNKPLIVTETGYSTGKDGIALVPDREIQAIYNLRSLFEFFRLNIKRTYIFSLLRFEPKPRYFSLIDPERTEEVTISFEAIKNTIAILDGGNIDFTPGELSYQMAGNLTNISQDLVLQKSDGKFYIVFWLAIPYNTSKLSKLVSFKLNTPGFDLANLYSPITHDSQAIEQINNLYSFQEIEISDIPIILELIPSPN